MLSLLHRQVQRTRDEIVARLADPFGFAGVLDDLTLEPHDLPGLHRERRLDGLGL